MKQYQYKITGMSQDSAYQIFNPDKAFSCQNIRFFKTSESMSLVKMCNERGNSLHQYLLDLICEKHSIDYSDITNFHAWGVCEIPNNYIVFASYVNRQDIGIQKDILISNEGIFYESSLEFNFKDEVQSICIQENDELIKVYFTDGKNPIMVIKITEDSNNEVTVDNIKKEILPSFTRDATVNIEKSFGGRFHSGMIQYAFTYANENMQETNLWHITPLYIVGNNNEGAAADEICNISFKITLDDVDRDYDYICIYGILRTSLDAEPEVYTLENINLHNSSDPIIITDTGANWTSYNASELVLKQRDRFVAKYMTSYGNRLFLANFKLTKDEVDWEADTMPVWFDYLKNSIHVHFEGLNNSENARDNTTFRSNEWYRIGIQFSDNYGSVSEVKYLDDILMDTLDPTTKTLLRKTIKATLPPFALNFGKYTKARLMMVDRTLLPHRSLCQGVLCPTVYRVQDRVDNAPFAMSSWSMRGLWYNGYVDTLVSSGPDVPLNYCLDKQTSELQNQKEHVSITDADWSDVSNELPPMLVRDFSYSGTGTKYIAHIHYDYIPTIHEGEPVWASSKIYYNIYVSDSDNTDLSNNTLAAQMELSCATAFADTSLKTLGGLLSHFEMTMSNYLDSLGTFYNPQRLVNILASQIRIKNANSLTTDYSSVVSDIHWASDLNVPVYDGDGIMTIENAHEAAQAMSDKPFISDHNILTFHSPDIEKQGSVIDNNSAIKYRVIGYTNMYKHYFDYYLDVTAPQDPTLVDGIQAVARNEDRPTYNAYLWGSHGYKFPVYIWNRTQALHSQVEAENGVWYSQVLKKIMCNKHFCEPVKGFSLRENENDPLVYFEGVDSVDSPININGEPVFPKMGIPRYFNSNEVIGLSLSKQPNSLNLLNTEVYQGNVDLMHSSTFQIPIKAVNEDKTVIFHPNGGDAINCADAIWMRYKSTPHIVIPMSYVQCDDYALAPSLPTPYGDYSSYEPNHGAYMWCDNVHGFLRSTIHKYLDYDAFDHDKPNSILYVAELYLDLNVDDIYPATESESQLWIPISDWGDLFAGENGFTLTGYGDTYLGNWDCLKTYAFSEDDLQQYKDVTSITLESDINPLGRYDKFKNSDSVLHASATTFNIYNDVYNQKDNLFTYRNLAKELNSFSSQLFYSQIKTLGEKVDSWSGISPISVLDTEGVNGEITGLISNNSGVYVFQKKAISKVSVNTRVAIPASDGVPITIGNNSAVDEPHLLTTNYGTNDIKFVKKLEDIIYFINNDNYYDLISISENDSISNLSLSGGMHTFLQQYNLNRLNKSYPERLLVDEEMKELYTQFDFNSLCYSVLMGGFTSFYDYEPLNHLFTYNNKSYGLTGNAIFEQRAGNYDEFFYGYKDYSITILANMEPTEVKTFTNVEYNMDSTGFIYDHATGTYQPSASEVTFNNIEVENSYQKGSKKIEWNKYNPSYLKRKLRVWRIDIPRHRNSLDRITDTWCKISLQHKVANDPLHHGTMSGVNYINVTYYRK